MQLIVVMHQSLAMKHVLVREIDIPNSSSSSILSLGRTALHYAAIENNMNGAVLLLKHGANIEAQDEHVSDNSFSSQIDFNH